MNKQLINVYINKCEYHNLTSSYKKIAFKFKYIIIRKYKYLKYNINNEKFKRNK